MPFGTEAAYDQYATQNALSNYKNQFGQTITGVPNYIYYNNGNYPLQTADVNAGLVGGGGFYAARSSNSFSTTNIQVQGVDEADIVKTDGNYIYEISRQELVILKAWPAQDLSIVSRTSVEGTPIAIFLTGDRVTVFSTVTIGSQTPVDPLVRTPDGFPLVYPSYTMVKITVVDVTDPTTPQVVQSTYLNGTYVNSREVGNDVYLVVENYYAGLPAPEYSNFNGTTIYESQASYLSRIQGHEADLSLPHFYVHANGPNSPLTPSGLVTDPANIYQPESANDNDLLTVLAFDPTASSPAPVSSVSLFTSYAYTVYASTRHLYVATPEWPASGSGADNGSRIDQFALNGTQVTLTGTGWVPGQAYQQFWLDEQGQYLRIVTVNYWGPQSSTGIYVLDGTNSSLPIVGKVENFITPGETLNSVRFMTDRLFLTTSQAVDPLYTIDLSQPTNPQAVVELHLPGPSSWFAYLQPLDDTHLLGVGQVLESNPAGNVALYSALQITLFDISDLSHPVALDQHVINPTNWSWWWGSGSEAEWDHHALRYFPESGELAIPIYGSYTGVQYTGFVSSLYVWKVDLTKGFTFLGQINQDSQVRRSLRINDQIYSIADDSVAVHPLADPNAPGVEVRVHDDPRFPVEYSVDAVVGTPFSGPLFDFTVTDPTGMAATIDWGDGQESDGTITPNGTGEYTVGGTHTYTQSNYYTIAVTFTRNGQTLDTLYNYLALVIVPQPEQQFVTQLYQDVLNREVDSFGLAGWGQGLNQGATPAAVALNVLDSKEYTAKTIDGFYMNLLSRHAEAAGLAGWQSFLAVGHTLDDVEAGILGSTEYFNLHGASTAGFLRAMYGDVLQRGIDAAGAANWGAALAGGLSRQAIVLQILQSTEAQIDTVQTMYHDYLHRSADAAGLASWVNALQHGATEQEVAAQILGSEEYAHLNP
jgi:uncharacterized secreted protein with C-terminal beta-propeller domain